MKNQAVLKGSLVTEKGTFLSRDKNIAIFRVDRRASKHEVRDAVEATFGVKVESVRTANFLGKTKRVGRHIGRRSDWKKAYVTLAPDSTLDLYAAE